MADLEEFRQKVRKFRLAAGFSQQDLADELGLHLTVLSNKLNGTKKAYLTHHEVKTIIKTLAGWEAIFSQADAFDLLACQGLTPEAFSPAEWNSPPLASLEKAAPPGRASASTSAASPEVARPAEAARKITVRPGSTLTFLFTDIEDSAGRWERDPVAMSAVLARHDRLVRQVIEEGGGVVFKTVGDGFYAVFNLAPAAVKAALAIQRQLQGEPWPGPEPALRVRMALHSGAVEEREADYFGPVVNRTARLLAAGYGNQILLSEVTFSLVKESLPAGYSGVDLGEHRFKGLAGTQRVYQLAGPGLEATFPPLKSLQARPTNLPAALAGFIGRQRELAEVKQGLAGARLLTLIGAGGAGKTSLALQAARELLHDASFNGGVWLVELAPLAGPHLVGLALTAALGIRENLSRPPVDSLVEFLADRTVLLVLDNCEHLIEECAGLAARLLSGCPRLKILATSREGLNIPGELTWRVPSLSLPDAGPHQPSNLDEINRSDAVQLFCEKARLANPRFRLTAQNAPAICELCRQLDGMPLALELAAARLRVLSLEQLVVRLSNRFALLTGGSRTALPRQQTLRATLDWSYNLLAPAEQELFQRLAVFAGSWSLEAAEALNSGPSDASGETLDLVSHLADKSLLIADEADAGVEGATRFRMLQTLREYGLEKLRESGQAPEVARRFCDYYWQVVEPACNGLAGPDQTACLQLLDIEYDNIRVALQWSLEQPGLENGLRTGAKLMEYWGIRGLLNEGRRWLGQALAKAPGQDTLLRMRLLNAGGVMALKQAAYAEAGAYFTEGLHLSRITGNKLATASLLNNLAVVSQEQGDQLAAAPLLEESLAILREINNRHAIASTLTNLGNLMAETGNLSRAAEYHQESLEIARQQEDQLGISTALENLGQVKWAQQAYRAALDLHLQSLAIRETLGSYEWVSITLHSIAVSALYLGDYGLAGRSLAKSIEIARQQGEKARLLEATLTCAALIAGQGQAGTAARLLGANETLRQSLNTPVKWYEKTIRERAVETIEAQLDGASLAAEYSQGRVMSLDQAVDLAMSVMNTPLAAASA